MGLHTCGNQGMLLVDQLDLESIRGITMVLCPQNFEGEIRIFQRVLSGGSHFSKCLGRKGFGEEFEFSDSRLGGGSLLFENL